MKTKHDNPIEIYKLKQKWRASQRKKTDKKIIEIFGKKAVKEIVENKIKEYEIKRKVLTKNIKTKFKNISKLQDKTDKFTIWFCEQLVDEFLVKKLIEIEKQLSRLYFQNKIAKDEKIERSGDWITQEQIQEALRYPIEQIAMNFEKANKRGNRIYTLCPFHNERYPSFVAYLDTNSWYCFGQCSRGGDIVSLIRELNNFNFKEAIYHLTNKHD